MPKNTEQSQPALVSQRLKYKYDTAFNRFVITPHRMSYFLPIMMTNSIHHASYENSQWAGKIKNAEAKF